MYSFNSMNVLQPFYLAYIFKMNGNTGVIKPLFVFCSPISINLFIELNFISIFCCFIGMNLWKWIHKVFFVFRFFFCFISSHHRLSSLIFVARSSTLFLCVSIYWCERVINCEWIYMVFFFRSLDWINVSLFSHWNCVFVCYFLL